MAKNIDDILSEAGLTRSASTSPAEAETGSGFADSPVKARVGRGTLTAPSIGSGKVKGRERLVVAASDAFRQARAQVRSERPAGKKPRGVRAGRQAMEDAATGAAADARNIPLETDVVLVRARPKSAIGSDGAPPDKVVVVSRSQGKIIGRQG